MPCEKVNIMCDKAQYCEATFWEKIVLNLHLVFCKACRKYTKNNSKLTETVKNSKLNCLDKACKENMKKELKKAMEEQSA
ncbi:hypothetical protein [Tamlana crocina]|nr:hypothetical protein [Tamlana crocina]